VIHRKFHDLKYQLEAVKRESSKEGREKMFSRMESEIAVYENMAKTGNVSLDYIISEKLLA
jgi:hypothetical protein